MNITVFTIAADLPLFPRPTLSATRRLVGFIVIAVTSFAWATAGNVQDETTNTLARGSHVSSGVADQLSRFVAEKQTLTAEALQAEQQEMLPEYAAMFEAASRGDWPAIRNIWNALRERAPQYEGDGPKDKRLHGLAWQAMIEIWCAFGNIAAGDGDIVVAFGEDTIGSIPPGSIYFGGTDPGRCVITALQKSQVNADPFFTLTQNALADRTYLEYLRDLYGSRIWIPSAEDSQKCFSEYLADAQRRLKEDKLKPGEDVTEVDGSVRVGGQVAVMAINGLLAKMIFDENPERAFYVEESFPLEWMYPHLSPNGPIMQINRRPLDRLTDDMLQKDRDYWVRAVQPLLGRWLDYDTSLQSVVDHARTRTPPQLVGDKRDPQADSAAKWAAKLRSSIAGLYAWRVEHAKDESERTRMAKEADFAFRQAFALCPYAPESVFRYVNLLLMQGRASDALLVAESAAQVDPDNDQVRQLVKVLRERRDGQ